MHCLDVIKKANIDFFADVLKQCYVQHPVDLCSNFNLSIFVQVETKFAYSYLKTMRFFLMRAESINYLTKTRLWSRMFA